MENKMIKLQDKIFNRDHIYYIKEDASDHSLHIVTSWCDHFVISYDGVPTLNLDREYLVKQVGFTDIKHFRSETFTVDMETLYLNLDNVVAIESYKKDDKTYLQIFFCNDKVAPLSFELNGVMYELDEPGDYMDSIMIGSRY